MFQELNQIIALQECDTRVELLKRELKQWPEVEAHARGRAAAAAALTAAAHKVLQGLELTLKRLELDAETRRHTIVRLKTQQYETRKNEEFRAIASEIERYEKDVDDLETNELEKMDELDAARIEWEKRQAEQALVEAEVSREVGVVLARLAEADAKLLVVKAERAQQAAEIDRDIVEQYERVARRKGIHTVVPVKHGVCGGCHMKVTHSLAMALRHQNELLHCDQCERFIYQDLGPDMV